MGATLFSLTSHCPTEWGNINKVNTVQMAIASEGEWKSSLTPAFPQIIKIGRPNTVHHTQGRHIDNAPDGGGAG